MAERRKEKACVVRGKTKLNKKEKKEDKGQLKTGIEENRAG